MPRKKDFLFDFIQKKRIFKDSKTLVDAIPRTQYKKIVKEYLKAEKKGEQDLYHFIKSHFILPVNPLLSFCHIEASSIRECLDLSWNVLEERFSKENEDDSLISLPCPHIVPGGRFREAYYWDSYFIAEGLEAKGRFSMIENMVKNLVYLQDEFGFIPNGNRLYYTTRSQPPVLVWMIDLLYQKYGLQKIKPYIEALEKEYAYWMKGSGLLNSKVAELFHVVRMPDGSILNRYCDETSEPRDEGYYEDMSLAEGLSSKEQRQLFQNLRSAAESGWLFSSRWLKDPKNLKTIQTKSIVPIDLNALLFGLEMRLSQYFGECGQKKKQTDYKKKAEIRKEAINRYLWNDQEGFYFDFDLNLKKPSSVYSAAGIVPLFVNLSSCEQAMNIERVIQEKFLKAGGLVATNIDSGLQWDYPHGMAPLQWFSVKGLLNYGYHDLAQEIMKRWLSTLNYHFSRNRVLVDKYNVCEPYSPTVKGEYPAQEGFGWTNGVAEKFLSLIDPDLLHHMPVESNDSDRSDGRNKINELLFGQENPTKKLSERETECLLYFLQGYTADQTSRLLEVSDKAVEFHLSNVKKKLSCYSRSQIFEVALKAGVIKFFDDSFPKHKRHGRF